MTELRVGIVGCGKIADQHVPAIRRIPFSRVVGTCDREPLMAAQLADRFGIPYSSPDLADMLATTRPDVVHVTTPPQSHFALAAACLEAGCHVYVEKPFTLNTDDARRLLKMAADRNLQITAGHNLQMAWETIDTRALVRAGYLGGPPVHVESYYTYRLDDPGYAKAVLGDRSHWVRALPGKLLHNIISHGVARIAEYMDTESPIVSATGYTSPMLQSIDERDIVDELRVNVWDGHNTTGCFVFSSQFAPPILGMRLYGARNSLVVDNLQRTVVRVRGTNFKSYLNQFVSPLINAAEYVRSSGRNVERFLRADFHDDGGLKNFVEAFYRSILGMGEAPLTNREIILTSIIMDEIFQQLTSRRLVATTASEMCSVV